MNTPIKPQPPENTIVATNTKNQVTNKDNTTTTDNIIPIATHIKENIRDQPTDTPHHKPTPIIIDNITTLSTQQIDKTLRETFKNINFTIQHLKKGGIFLTPEPSLDWQHHTNKMLQTANYPQEVFGSNLYLHIAGKVDTIPWLCISQIPVSLSTQEIET